MCSPETAVRAVQCLLFAYHDGVRSPAHVKVKARADLPEHCCLRHQLLAPHLSLLAFRLSSPTTARLTQHTDTSLNYSDFNKLRSRNSFLIRETGPLSPDEFNLAGRGISTTSASFHRPISPPRPRVDGVNRSTLTLQNRQRYMHETCLRSTCMLAAGPDPSAP
jgi:hypothetical protein